MGGLRHAINLSILFTELPLLERPQAARQAGFDAVEFWWPWQVPVPSDAEVDAFVAAVTDAGVQLIGLNFFAGDMPGGDRGLVSWAARSSEFHDNIDATIGVGERLGCRAFNALYGNRQDDGGAAADVELLGTQNLVRAAKAAGRIGGTVLVEPVSGAPHYPLLTAADALRVVDLASAEGVDNVRMLFDIYHLAVNGDDVEAAIDKAAGRIGHVQIADAPGRHEPGTGKLPIDHYLDRIAATGYDGWVALEYSPSGASQDSLDWLPRERRSAH